MNVRNVPSRWRSSITTEGYTAEFLCVVHPGGILGDELEELGISPHDFAEQIDVPATLITQILDEEVGISGDVALRLGHWFGTSPQLWMNLQSTYELNKARRDSGAEIGRLPRRERSEEPAQ